MYTITNVPRVLYRLLQSYYYQGRQPVLVDIPGPVSDIVIMFIAILNTVEPLYNGQVGKVLLFVT